MTDIPGSPDIAGSHTVPPREHRDIRAGLVSNAAAHVGLAILLVIAASVLGSFYLDWFHPDAGISGDLSQRNGAPGVGGHLLGTDTAGRDVLLRLIVASQTTILGAGLAVVVALLVSMPLGLSAGYFGGKLDAISQWVAALIMSLPSLLLLITLVSVTSPATTTVMTFLGLLMFPAVFRLVRGQVIAVKNELYVDAARISGLSDARIIARHVFGVVRGPIVIMTAILCGVAVTAQAGLDFIGLGDSQTATWGQMMNEGFLVFYSNKALFIWPGITLTLTIAAFMLVGNGMRDAFARTSEDPAAGSRSVERIPLTQNPSPAPDADIVLAVRDLVVAYPGAGHAREVVRSAEFALRRGHTLGVVGESGSGKTQTAFAILDLLPAAARIQRGEIWLDGVNTLSLAAAERGALVRSRVAYVPQEPMSNLDPAFTIGFQLVEPLRVRGMSKKDARKRALELLARVGIPEPERTFASYPHQISGGMAQRVLIAGAVSTDPAVLIADEPTTALDVTVQAEILDLFRDLQAEFGMSILLVTHNLGVVADLCDDVAVMRNGEVVETATVEEFFAGPQHPYSRTLLGSMPDPDHIRPPFALELGDDAAHLEKTTP
ncbi:dipeptide/oligopeptide/nickel ABC transporter permease/ATP-binding protein [Nocardia tengchongensis]|uniref:dipeptide/oligopeptide/nickel ABC transporter permease/ATP-binding protein n=1 Tax=Nocardia tengchongensis TaxID=2055889 RepID=UPI00365B7771